MAKKYYVVWNGRKNGIFADWDTCKKSIDRFAGAKYKSFKTKAEAESAFASGGLSTAKKTGSSASTVTKARLNTIKTYTADEIMAMPINVKIYTDGGCEPNPGKAGSGISIYRDNQIAELWYGLFNPNGTNNTAELNALNQALKIAQAEIRNGNSVAIFCDSKYSIQSLTQWAVNWEKNGWKKASGEIKNLDLIKEMFALYRPMKNKLAILHVNGHVGVEGNELADRMSIIAIDYKEQSFKRYQQDIDIPSILSLRGG